MSVASVVKWSQRFRATGSPAARKVGGRRPYALSGERDWLLTRLSKQPDVTLRSLAAELAERGIKVSYYAVCHFFEHEGISFKKKACTPASRIAPMSPGGERNGSVIKAGLIRTASSSSTRPGPRPT